MSSKQMKAGWVHFWIDNGKWWWCYDGCADAKQGPFDRRAEAWKDAKAND